MSEHSSAITTCVKEIVDLHVFFVRWFTDTGFANDKEANCAFDEFLARFADSFEYVFPNGAMVRIATHSRHEHTYEHT